jgi:hypothetical protein
MMNRWTNRHIGFSSAPTDVIMDFNQGEFDLSGNGSEEGYRKWQLDLDEKKRAFEVRHGVLIGRKVRVQLIGELNPLEGMIYLVSPKTPQSGAQIRLSLGNREFTPRQIESIVRIEDAGPQ